MENKINLIKFMVNKCNNFHIKNTKLDECLYCSSGYDYHGIEIKVSHRSILYPTLLSKTIDSINETDPWKIEVYYVDTIGWFWSYKDYGNYSIYKEADQAREAAIKYYMNMEDKTNGKNSTREQPEQRKTTQKE